MGGFGVRAERRVSNCDCVDDFRFDVLLDLLVRDRFWSYREQDWVVFVARCRHDQSRMIGHFKPIADWLKFGFFALFAFSADEPPPSALALDAKLIKFMSLCSSFASPFCTLIKKYDFACEIEDRDTAFIELVLANHRLKVLLEFELDLRGNKVGRALRLGFGVQLLIVDIALHRQEQEIALAVRGEEERGVAYLFGSSKQNSGLDRLSLRL
ncbi:hypothetical protein L1887_63332 [Cichorium endivia]|nr:hypothetical protein L1887_63332 [Cichorium endivia]